MSSGKRILIASGVSFIDPAIVCHVISNIDKIACADNLEFKGIK